jgi:hypothetical protein
MRKNIRGGKDFKTYWSIKSVISRATNRKSHPKYGDDTLGIDIPEGQWTCQSCGKVQADELPYYLIPLDEMIKDIFKICSVCKHEQIIHKIETIHQLIRLVRYEK